VGGQAGIKYIDAFHIDHLDIQMEFNIARPYLYTHLGQIEDIEISPMNYSHFSQALAHPLGANFMEFLWEVKYAITPKLQLQPRFLYALQGLDKEGEYYGANILIPNGKRVGTANQKFLQGEALKIYLIKMNLSYEFFDNAFADLNIQYRNSISYNEKYNGQSLYFGVGIRINFYNRDIDY
jgi:hypothetical protein